MANDIFVDTSGFYALLIRDDKHREAGKQLREARQRKRFLWLRRTPSGEP